MSDATFQTFLASGLLVLIASIGYLAWSAWRWVDRARDMEKLALAGIGYELRMNLMRMMSELAGVANGTVKSEIELVPVVHPQLDALLSRPNEADRESLTLMRGNYNELSAHKQTLRAALSAQADLTVPASIAVDAVIGSIATLYLWEEHKGRSPKAAPSTRSWHVRDWMKANDFKSDLLPGLHLRDQVVDRLRALGMTLTPKPLTHTASEFYAMQYDRKADPNAPFWKRKPKPVPVETPEEVVEAEPETDLAPPEAEPAVAAPEIAPEPEAAPEIAAEPEPFVEPAAEPDAAPVTEAAPATDPAPPPAADAPVEADAGTEAVDAPADSPPDTKSQTPGSVH